MKPTKLSAYTLVEVLVVLVVSSILLGIGMLLYSNVTSYFSRLRQRTEQIQAVERLWYLVENDWRKYSDFSTKDNKLSSSSGRLAYYFYTDSIVRYQGEVEEVFYIENKPILSDSMFDFRVNLYGHEVRRILKRDESYEQKRRRELAKE